MTLPRLICILALAVWAGSAALAAPEGKAETEAPMCVAVPPFQNITARAEDAYLEAGFAEVLATALARVRTIQVVERGQLRSVLDELKVQNSGLVDEASARQIGELLGAGHLVLGAYQRAGAQMRVTCRLVDTATGRVDADHTVSVTKALARDEDLFDLQDDLVATVVRGFGAQPDAKEQDQIAEVVRATSSTEAYSSYALGRSELSALTHQSLDRAVSLFQKATEADPKYALAWAGLAEALAFRCIPVERQKKGSSKPLARRALDAAEKALALGPNLAESHRAFVAASIAAGGKEAARSPRVTAALAKALSLNDRDPGTYLFFWGVAGRPLSGPGSEYIRKALELNPRYFPGLLTYGQTLRQAKRNDEAIEILQRATAASPRSSVAATALVAVLEAKGDRPGAVRVLQGFVSAAQNDPNAQEHVRRARQHIGRLTGRKRRR